MLKGPRPNVLLRGFLSYVGNVPAPDQDGSQGASGVNQEHLLTCCEKLSIEALQQPRQSAARIEESLASTAKGSRVNWNQVLQCFLISDVDPDTVRAALDVQECFRTKWRTRVQRHRRHLIQARADAFDVT